MMTDAAHTEHAIQWGFASRALPGETDSGDRHVVRPSRHGFLVAVIDGLGHGHEATAAAQAAVSTLERHTEDSILSLVKHCHAAMTKTRGATMAIASINVLDGTMSWLGVGTVEGCLIRADNRQARPTETLLLRGGVVGFHLPALQASVVPVYSGDLLVLASDGVRSGFEKGIVTTDLPTQIAERILAKHLKGTDDALVVVVRYVGTRHESTIG